MNGNLTGVEFILRQSNGTDINTEGTLGATPLIVASTNGHHEVVKRLLEEKEIDINKPDSWGSTALMYASVYRNYEVAQLLLDTDGIEINAVEITGGTALKFASESGYPEIVELLLSRQGIEINKADYYKRTPLLAASAAGNSEVVRLLLEEEDIDINKVGDGDGTGNTYGSTALIVATENGHIDVVQMLLGKEKTDINLIDNNGKTAFDLALDLGRAELVQLLLEHPKTNITKGMVADETEIVRIASIMFNKNIEKLDINQKILVAALLGNTSEVSSLLHTNETILNTYDSFHRTPLFWASTRGHSEVVRFLLDHNHILVNTGSSINGATALHQASKNGHRELVNLLLENKKILVNIKRSSDGTTALYLASRYGHTEVVAFLLGRPNIIVNVGRSSDGANSLYQASRYGHLGVVKILLEHQMIDVNYATLERKTSLMAASICGHLEIVRAFLSHVTIDVNYSTFDGLTALIYAVLKKRPLILDLLLRCPQTNPHLYDEEYQTALDRAKEINKTELIQLFETRGKLQMVEGHTCCSKLINRGLHVAVKNRDSQWIKKFLVCPGIEINVRDKDGQTPLNLATERGIKEMVEIFLADQRIDVNKPNTRDKNNALLISSEKGHIAITKLLLRHNQTFVNQENSKKQSALLMALEKMTEISSSRRYFQIVKLLLKCPKTESTIESHMGVDLEELVDLRSVLMEKNPTCCHKVNESLLGAAWVGDFRAIRGLIQCPGSESNINTVDKKGRTPLYIASTEGHLQAVQVLLNSSDIDVNIGVRIDGGTPFSKASEKAHFQVMRALTINGLSEEDKGWCRDGWVHYLKPCHNESKLFQETIPLKPISGDPSYVNLTFQCSDQTHMG